MLKMDGPTLKKRKRRGAIDWCPESNNFEVYDERSRKDHDSPVKELTDNVFPQRQFERNDNHKRLTTYSHRKRRGRATILSSDLPPIAVLGTPSATPDNDSVYIPSSDGIPCDETPPKKRNKSSRSSQKQLKPAQPAKSFIKRIRRAAALSGVDLEPTSASEPRLLKLAHYETSPLAGKKKQRVNVVDPQKRAQPLRCFSDDKFSATKTGRRRFPLSSWSTPLSGYVKPIPHTLYSVGTEGGTASGCRTPDVSRATPLRLGTIGEHEAIRSKLFTPKQSLRLKPKCAVKGIVTNPDIEIARSNNIITRPLRYPVDHSNLQEDNIYFPVHEIGLQEDSSLGIECDLSPQPADKAHDTSLVNANIENSECYLSMNASASAIPLAEIADPTLPSITVLVPASSPTASDSGVCIGEKGLFRQENNIPIDSLCVTSQPVARLRGLGSFLNEFMKTAKNVIASSTQKSPIVDKLQPSENDAKSSPGRLISRRPMSRYSKRKPNETPSECLGAAAY